MELFKSRVADVVSVRSHIKSHLRVRNSNKEIMVCAPMVIEYFSRFV